MIDLVRELVGYPGVPHILGGALTAVGTVSAVVWSSWKQASAERNRSKAHALNFVLQATQVSYKLNELVFRILDSDPAKEAEKKDLEDMERDAARQQTNFSSFPIHELPLKLVPIAHEFRTTWADVYLFCSDVIKGGEPVDRDFKVHVLALRAQGYEQLFEIRKYTRTQHDNTERSRELEKKMQEINERLEREEEELNEEVGNSTTRTASAPRSWWPF